MSRKDTIEFEAVDVAALQRAHEAAQPPARFPMGNGDTLETLNAATGTYKITDMAGHVKGYAHAENVEYMPTLNEQWLASRDTVPRLPRLEA